METFGELGQPFRDLDAVRIPIVDELAAPMCFRHILRQLAPHDPMLRASIPWACEGQAEVDTHADRLGQYFSQAQLLWRKTTFGVSFSDEGNALPGRFAWLQG